MIKNIATIFLFLGVSLFSYDDFIDISKNEKIAQRIKDTEFEKLVRVYANKNIEYPNLKAVTLAMMILESGRGKSDLAKVHKNFAGLKYRKEMKNYAKKVRYGDGDGDNSWFYCKFDNHSRFIDGFWAFLDRKPYRGWRKKSYSSKAFINKIASVYCPYNKNYAKHVLSLIPEARMLLEEYQEPVYKLASVN